MSSAVYLSPDGVDRNSPVKRAQLGKILEGFGITLANNIGAAVAIKNPDQLPGVAIWSRIIIRCIIVITNHIADLLAEIIQLVVISIKRGVFDNFPRICNCRAHSQGITVRNRILSTSSIICRDKEGHSVACKLDIAITASIIAYWERIIVASRLVEPV